MSFKETEFGRVPSDWNIDIMENTLDAIIDYRGKTPKKAESGIETLSAKSVKNGFIDYSSCYYISKETYDKFMVRGYPQKGDILMTTEAPLGCVAKLDKNDIAIAQRLLTLRGKDTILDNDYLMYYLMSKVGQHQLNIRATGTTVLGIKQTEFRKVPILLPQLEEQKAIAKILSDLDEKVEINNKINKNLEEMAQAIFKQWFVDFEFPNEEGKPYKSSGGEMVESELGMIPKDFNVISIYDVANIIYGAPFKSKLFNEDKKGLPLIRIRDLKSGTPNFYTEEEHSKATIVKTGDILVGMDAEFTPTIWHGETGYLNQRVCMFKSKISYISDYFLYESIKPYMKFMESAKVGTTVIHLGKSDIDKLTIILPSIDIIKRFSEISNSILVKMINIYNENRNLNKLRDTLLPKLMSGEIRVPLEN
ncbi:restriction endonuclease subunit S [Clostridium perfringens]